MYGNFAQFVQIEVNYTVSTIYGGVSMGIIQGVKIVFLLFALLSKIILLSGASFENF